MESEHKRKNAIYRKILTVNDDFKLFNDDKNYNSAKPLNKKPIIKTKTSDFTKDYLKENLIINENLKETKKNNEELRKYMEVEELSNKKTQAEI